MNHTINSSQATVTPGVVTVSRFVTPGRETFQDYVEYIDREDAKKEHGAHAKMFSLYQDYMGDTEKTSSLFTEHSNRLKENEKKELKQLFQLGQKNGSIMWQDVITFDNHWLAEQGVYDAKTRTVDETKLIDVTRLAMAEMLKREKLEHTAVWSGAIHYNTDNIHIHVATVEPFPTRDRGKRKQKTLDAMKGKVVQNLLDRGQEQKQINDLIRKNMVSKKKEDSTLTWRNRELKPLFKFIYKRLPDDKRQWQYSYNTLRPLRPYLDDLTQKYIEKNHKEDYIQFLEKLDKEVDVLKRAYGEGTGDKKRYENYKENKIEELHKRMGNAFLQEMKEYDKERQRIDKMLERKTMERKNFQQNVSMQYALRKMEGALKSEYESWKNQRYYERLQKEIQYQNERGYER
ncbi:MobP2 family relaxase [Bacillus sp. BP-3]|uniref:MobP2 family relaxase n=1 Tax=Bacillus sp. BP-3 TaxID=3022773 RepID=UPI0023304CF9|nr:MobP2 family relaxase [Bacillus sp. BP-3]MDC2867797.1 relaxase MobL [Bacillus sp. BP-3]